MGVPRGLSQFRSENSFLLKGEDGVVGVGVGDSAGWPKTRPVVAAATTVPVPTRLGTVCILTAANYPDESQPQRRGEDEEIRGLVSVVVRIVMTLFGEGRVVPGSVPRSRS